jgi:D-arabinose 1-dehydrogenase-like Zn-dependent alcohol dehydrogenase
VVEEVPEPSIGPGDLLVKVAACGVCHTDMHYIEGVPTVKKPPITLGHEVSGRVVKMGREVRGFREGDPVLLPVLSTCGTCSYCRNGNDNLCPNMLMLGNHIDGGFAEYVAFPAKDAIPLPSEIPLEESCIISDAVAVAYAALKRRAKLLPGETLAVFGCGGLGLNFVQMGKVFGAFTIAVDIADEKLKVAKELGADEVINASREDPVKAIRRIAREGVDVAAEVIGKPEVMRQAFEVVRPGGRVLIVGFSPADLAVNAGRLMFREISILGVLGCPKADYPPLLRLVKEGRIKIKPLVSHKFRLEQINEAFDMLKKGALLRGIVIPST